jgi:hypothetical protein
VCRLPLSCDATPSILTGRAHSRNPLSCQRSAVRGPLSVTRAQAIVIASTTATPMTVVSDVLATIVGSVRNFERLADALRDPRARRRDVQLNRLRRVLPALKSLQLTVASFRRMRMSTFRDISRLASRRRPAELGDGFSFKIHHSFPANDNDPLTADQETGSPMASLREFAARPQPRTTGHGQRTTDNGPSHVIYDLHLLGTSCLYPEVGCVSRMSRSLTPQ